MSVTVRQFDTLQNGQSVHIITMTNQAGTEVSLLTLGAAIQAFRFAGKDLVLGFDRAEHYFHSGAYIGATVGRICNRTADGRFELNGTTYNLVCNEPDRRVHLHGGKVGFDKKVWDYTIIREEELPCVTFSTVSPDGEEGYPGTLMLEVTYTLTEANELILDYKAQSDADTPLNLTNHTYFNLNGCDGKTVHNNLLQINAAEYTPVTERLVPTGEYAPVEGTAIDFRMAKPIGEALYNEDASMAYTGGVDHNFVLAHTRPEAALEAAYAYSPDTGIQLRCYTDLPGIQVYTGNFLDEPGGKYGLKWGQHQGFCLETQFFANSINQPNFPSIVLKAGDTFHSRTTYAVSQKEEG
ncbi:MAG: galactose mutarotase [Ruminococcaceae bacterium]|nr:galactose mutarotase [Oscillospiraceae bacterium]